MEELTIMEYLKSKGLYIYDPSHMITEEQAKEKVGEMYHYEGSRKLIGEKYSMKKAYEICEKYKGFLPNTVTPSCVYMAVNSHYHDYAMLFKSWFGEDIDCKVVEAALTYWFKDEDYGNHHKVYDMMIL